MTSQEYDRIMRAILENVEASTISDDVKDSVASLALGAPDLLAACEGDEENCVPNAQTILAQALLGNYEAVKVMLKELCSIHATAIKKARGE